MTVEIAYQLLKLTALTAKGLVYLLLTAALAASRCRTKLLDWQIALLGAMER
jgi:hypothetical protein